MDLTPPTAIILLTEGGWETARKLQALYPEALIHGLAGRVSGADITFQQTAQHLQELFKSQTPIIGICASAILVRCLAPALKDKLVEPPVVSVSEIGSIAVPLLGGHHGANDMARDIAEHLNGTAAVTTASDLHYNIALDSPPPGLHLANPEHMKTFTGNLLAGQKVKLLGESDWLSNSDLPFAEEGQLTIEVTTRDIKGSPDKLVYHPKLLAIGVGCERHADPSELITHVRENLKENKLSPLSVGTIASIDLKSDEHAVHSLADYFGLQPRFFNAERLEQETDRLVNPSDVVFQEVGCHGVSEGAALAAVGKTGMLILPKVKSARTTMAVAIAELPLEPERIGVPQGKLSIIGIGPGQEPWRTPEASQLIREATDLVAYGLYIDLLEEAALGKVRHDFNLGEEEDRVRYALDLAAQGKNVALISSGDIGIYAMATLVYELIEIEKRGEWDRLELQVTPGISALQAAAARAGAPLGHDFCTISLSDLLTPWEAIEKRLKAAAEGDFVVAFYNPVSKKRRTQLHAAKSILLEKRPETTPVIVARNLGRSDETVKITTLQELDPETVDMLTLVMVGSSESKVTSTNSGLKNWAFTPRGYAGKMQVTKKETEL
ncbi:precorrin-3B C(17)-methyltransferase [Sneathiella limimaris]|uniref:precorrin-3B C(17)-methyltransferase n=1 Tax=Sneathiella limimaris TaxID=1964213 RepID=UPI00146F651F|nr:precorrin-3B C(17)-methyltransferase [Sneathiella limimaris]